ncbi:transposase [Wolbachia endosymbiont of Frankliniella intonsa]|nr:DDE-type integrase/transposase/recombinase [Wolbachia endosymbiont of Frankliniella intonsa]WGJ61625.1 transposase [Wolbachia endosymbiont of Frankliniella intonsa]
MKKFLKITVLQIKYLNNIVDRFIKKLIKPMLGFKSFHSAKITITGIENIRMIQKRQIIKIMFLLLRILLC